MLGRGDWRKLEDAINAVTVPLGERVAELEAQVAELKGNTVDTETPVKKVNIKAARTAEEKEAAKA